MNDGGGARERISEVASPYPLDGDSLSYQGRKSVGEDDESPVCSMYSSCGESESGRYASANSVIGTPSLCSSMGTFYEFGDSEFGSLKSLNLADGDHGFEGFSLSGSGKSPREFRDTVLTLSSESHCLGNCNDTFCEANCPEDKLSVQIEGFRGLMGSQGGGQMEENKDHSEEIHKDGDGETGGKEDLGVLLQSVENMLVQGSHGSKSTENSLVNGSQREHDADQSNYEGYDQLCLQPDQEFDYRVRECTDQEQSSSRYEHSEDEDSMFNYGSRDENIASPLRNSEYQQESEVHSGNLLMMNASVAYGSKDWEDFELDEVTISQTSDTFWEQKHENVEPEMNHQDFSYTTPVDCGQFERREPERGGSGVHVVSEHMKGIDEPSEYRLGCSVADTESLKYREEAPVVDVIDTSVASKLVHSDDGSEEYLDGCSIQDVFKTQDSLERQALAEMGSVDCHQEEEHQFTTHTEVNGHDNDQIPQQQLEPLARISVQASLPTNDVFKELPTLNSPEVRSIGLSEGYESTSFSPGSQIKDRRTPNDLTFSHKTAPGKDKKIDQNACYDEVVHEMEEILLDSGESPVARFDQSSEMYHSQQPSPLRDGGSTASTSGMDDDYPMIHHPLEIDEIEVVGAKQKRGDISLSERLVGVKEYTVYVIRVWSGKGQWEVERRYRDFYTLYRRLKTLFADQGWILPPPWSSVEQESKKFFGNASPDVIAERSILIQECLRSLLQSEYSSRALSTLIWFLSSQNVHLSSSQSNARVNQSTVDADIETKSSLGKTISLKVEIHPQKSMKQLLEAQHYICAGCHKCFDSGKTRMREFVQTFGWGKPRLCEYTGQLFCSSCHSNDTAVLPARVLHHWNFTQYPVSQLAKSYLDSILDKPMLCVSAVNPFLFSKVPALLHVVGVRRKIGAMLPYIQCSFRRSIYRRLGSRKYLLESNDFFALRDLIDLSKGAFAALPVMLEAVLKKIQEHITELCLECCDHGIPCGARQACDEPSSLIFPFQDEDEIQRCKSCKSVFHKHCFEKLPECACGERLKPYDKDPSISKSSLKAPNAIDGASSSLVKKSDVKSPAGLLSALFSARRRNGHSESDNVVLMGSLPSTSL